MPALGKFLSLLLLAALPEMAAVSSAAAEPPPPSATLRQWPEAGKWRVILVRARPPGGPLACLLMTGYQSAASPAYRVWGIRSDGKALFLITNSKRPEDVAGPDLTVSIDGHAIGTFAVTDRPISAGGVLTAIAGIPDGDRQKQTLDLVKSGSVLRIANGQAAFEEHLDATAANNFDECMKAVANPPSQQLQKFSDDMLTYFRQPDARAMVDELFAVPPSDLARPDRVVITGTFLSHLIDADPVIRDRLVEWAVTANDTDKAIVLAALNLSHDARRIELIRKIGGEAALKRLVPPDFNLLELPITQPTHLDMMWVSFFATGDTRYIDRVAEAAGMFLSDDKMRELAASAKDNPQAREQVMKAAIGRAAVWSLSSNAMRFTEVREALVNFVQHDYQGVSVALVALILARTAPK